MAVSYLRITPKVGDSYTTFLDVALGERAFADRPGYALRQGSRCHALKIRSWPSPLEAASSRFAEYAGLSRVGVAAVPSLAARAHLPPSARSVVPKIATFVRSGRLAVAPGGDT